VEQLAERLRKMEETNKKLAEQLERSTREHDEQMRLLLGKYAESEKRLSNGAEGEGVARPSSRFRRWTTMRSATSDRRCPAEPHPQKKS
jgi:hypothetical protein